MTLRCQISRLCCLWLKFVSNGESEKKNKNPLSDVYALFRAALPFHGIQCPALPMSYSYSLFQLDILCLDNPSCPSAAAMSSLALVQRR